MARKPRIARAQAHAFRCTYSWSTGRLLMPRSGGAIQPAILPGSITRCMSECTKARSSSLGIQSVEPPLVFVAADQPALRLDRQAGPRADRAAEARGGQRQREVVAGALDHAVPALEADLAVLEIRTRASPRSARSASARLCSPSRRLELHRRLAQHVVLVGRLVRPALHAAARSWPPSWTRSPSRRDRASTSTRS